MNRGTGQLLKQILAANLRPRRIIAIIFGLACFGVCIAAIFGNLTMPLWMVICIFVVGLIFLEWAG